MPLNREHMPVVLDLVSVESQLQHPPVHFMSYRIRKKGEEARGKEGGLEGLLLTFSPPLPPPPSHPFNPATAAGAILMPLNADEVKMCLKERIPVGEGSCMHARGYEHTLSHTHTHSAHVGLWILKHSFHMRK